jgi:hypothetical protein
VRNRRSRSRGDWYFVAFFVCFCFVFQLFLGVEHLLRDVKDLNITSLSQQVTEKILSLRALQMRLIEAHEYDLSDLSRHIKFVYLIADFLQVSAISLQFSLSFACWTFAGFQLCVSIVLSGT